MANKIPSYNDAELLELPFDLCPVPRASLDDLSRGIFENEYLQAAFAPDVLKENNRTYVERLSSCKMIVSPENAIPTILGILTLGKIPQDYIPGAYVQFLRIDGKELVDPVIDEEEIKGTMIDVIRRTLEPNLQTISKKKLLLPKRM